MKTSALIHHARQRITPPEKWTTKALARDKDGDGAAPDGSNAVCWCAKGAVYAQTSYTGTRYEQAARVEAYDAFRIMRVAANILHENYTIEMVNDQMGHTETLRVMDAAHLLALKEES